MHTIIIPTSVFGAERVKEEGQHTLATLIRSNGGDGIEIRRELFPSGELPLAACHEVINNQQLRCVYSVPIELWDKTGQFNEPGILKALVEARTLKPEMLKVSLGHYHGRDSLDQLARLLGEYRREAGPLTLLVENDQTPHGGKVSNLLDFFKEVAREGISDVRMTFDTGNWVYSGEDAFAAAECLSVYVGYIHCKHVEMADGVYVTLPLPPEDEADWRKLLELLPDHVPRAIEFVLPSQDSLAYYINLLGRKNTKLILEEGR